MKNVLLRMMFAYWMHFTLANLGFSGNKDVVTLVFLVVLFVFIVNINCLNEIQTRCIISDDIREDVRNLLKTVRNNILIDFSFVFVVYVITLLLPDSIDKVSIRPYIVVDFRLLTILFLTVSTITHIMSYRIIHKLQMDVEDILSVNWIDKRAVKFYKMMKEGRISNTEDPMKQP